MDCFCTWVSPGAAVNILMPVFCTTYMCAHVGHVLRHCWLMGKHALRFSRHWQSDVHRGHTGVHLRPQRLRHPSPPAWQHFELPVLSKPATRLGVCWYNFGFSLNSIGNIVSLSWPLHIWRMWNRTVYRTPKGLARLSV